MREERDESARRRVAAALIAIAILVALIVLLRHGGDESGRSASSTPTATGAPTVNPITGGPSPLGGAPGAIDSKPIGWGPSPDTIDSRPLPEGIDQPTQFPGINLPPGDFPYPPGSQPLVEGVDPASAAPEDDPVDAKSGIHVVFQPRVGVVHPPDPIIVDLAVLDGHGKRVEISNAFARFRADGTTIEAGPWFSAPFVEAGLLYSATYAPTADQQALFAKGGQHVFIEVHFEAPNGLGPRTYSTVVMYGRTPHASLTGQYADSFVNGSLVIQAGIRVDAPGDYRLIGSLYGPDGSSAIGFAVAVGTFAPGDSSLSLTYFGKILHDKAIDGPYVLRYVMLFERGSNGDDIPGVTVDPAFTTNGSYKASDFSPDAYQPPPPPTPAIDPNEANKPPPMITEAMRKEAAAHGGTAPHPTPNATPAPH